MTRPCLRMTRHLLQIFLTLGLTFMVISPQAWLAVSLPVWCLSVGSFVPVDDAPATQVVGAELHDDPVIGEDPDVVHPHLPADVGEHLVPIVQLHAEKGIRQRLDYRALNLDGAVFLGHILRASLIGLPAPATAGLSG